MADAVSEIIMMFPYLFRHFFHSGDRVHFFLLLLCTVRSFGFSLALFWVFITFVHVRSAHNSHFIYAFGFHIIYWSIFGACCIEIERKRRKKVAHIWVWAFKSIIINVFVFAHIHFISNIFSFLYQPFSPEAIRHLTHTKWKLAAILFELSQATTSNCH